MFMGDRWSFPKQASAATYVWQPLKIAGTSIAMPTYKEAWQIDVTTGIAVVLENSENIIKNSDNEIQFNGNWKHTESESKSDEKDASFSVKFNGKQITLYSISALDNGYAKVVLTNQKGKILITALVDMYSKFSISAPVFKSPILKKGNYKLTVSVTGERPNWSDKKKSNYGSIGNFISLNQIRIQK
jgi:hypothetical protein